MHHKIPEITKRRIKMSTSPKRKKNSFTTLNRLHIVVVLALDTEFQCIKSLVKLCVDTKIKSFLFCFAWGFAFLCSVRFDEANK